MQLCERNKCTGCGVCKAVCTHNAITFDIDNLGFRYPIIDATKCVGCGLCAKKCPTLNPVSINTRNDCYLAWAKNDTIHYNSSSGGLAYILSKQIINQGGYIVGCVWDADFNAVLTVLDKEENIANTIGSKYVQSYISDLTWNDIKQRDKAGQKGLVIGLPCQVAALKVFTNYSENIIFVDLLCRGGCSPACLKTHLSYLKKRKWLQEITDVKFRGGKYDCYITLWNQSRRLYKGGQFSDAYFYSFMKHGLLHESCYDCQYANSNRVSDITLADYQGVDSEFVKDKNIMNGTSLVLIHSDKGQEAWCCLNNQIEYYERPLNEAVEGNSTLIEPTPPPSDRAQLLQLIKDKGFEKAVRYDKVYWQNVIAYEYRKVLGIIRMFRPGIINKLLKKSIHRL